MSRFATILLSLFISGGQSIINVSVNWSDVIGESDIVPSVNVIVSPLLLPESPVFDNLWKSLSDLNTSYLRLQQYRYYPRLCVAQLEPPSDKYLCKHLNGDSYYQNWYVSISCPTNDSYINDIQFASYGNPSGNCGNFSIDPDCHYNETIDIVQKLCLNKNSCTIYVSDTVFGNNDNSWCLHKNINLHSFSVQVTCNIDYKYSNWNFTQMDKTVNTLLSKTNNSNSILLFSAKPDWEFNVHQNVQIGENVTDNPYNTTLNYCQPQDGCYAQYISNISSPSGLVHYLSQIINWYQNGKLVDEYGNIYHNLHKLNKKIDYFEVLNEPDIHNEFTVENYTAIYDHLINNVQTQNIDPNNDIKYIGLVLNNPQNNLNWFTYFLNKSNHLNANIPIEYISFHHYASIKSEDRNNASSYTQLFESVQSFVWNTTVDIIQIKNQLNPSTKIIIDELGTMLQPIDADLRPLQIYYNFAGGIYLYGLTELMKINKLYNGGIIAVHNSAYIGYPYLTSGEFNNLSPGGIPPMWVSLSSMNWTNGVGTAKYWAQKLFLDTIGLNDELVNTYVSNTDSLYAQGFIINHNNSNNKVILLINKCYQNITATIKGMHNGAIAYTVDQTTDNNPPRKQIISSDIINLMPYAVSMLYPN